MDALLVIAIYITLYLPVTRSYAGYTGCNASSGPVHQPTWKPSQRGEVDWEDGEEENNWATAVLDVDQLINATMFGPVTLPGINISDVVEIDGVTWITIVAEPDDTAEGSNTRNLQLSVQCSFEMSSTCEGNIQGWNTKSCDGPESDAGCSRWGRKTTAASKIRGDESSTMWSWCAKSRTTCGRTLYAGLVKNRFKSYTLTKKSTFCDRMSFAIRIYCAC